MKPNCSNELDRTSQLDDTETVSAAEGDCVSDFRRPAESAVLLSVPTVGVMGDRLFAASHFDHDAPSPDAASVATSAAVVPLSIPEANLLQSLVQETKQRVIDLASGSVFWRLFVGSGVALLMGAVTLMLFGPSQEQVQSDEMADVASHLRPVEQAPGGKTNSADAQVSRSKIKLTVSESPHAGAVPAEIDDPFTAANLVSPKIEQAVHFADARDQGRTIQTAAHTRTVSAQPAWLSGTIDIEEDADPVSLKRKHERSRPSNR